LLAINQEQKLINYIDRKFILSETTTKMSLFFKTKKNRKLSLYSKNIIFKKKSGLVPPQNSFKSLQLHFEHDSKSIR
jgi:hypothetical protein